MTVRTTAKRLTKSIIDRVQPGPKDEFHWDAEAGFGLKVTPAGKRTFIVQGRIKGAAGGAIRITIGPYGPFTVEQAREVAREHLRSMRMGVDPRNIRREEEAQAVTVRQAADAYFARGLLKDATRRAMDRHIKTAFAKWENRTLVSITPAECRALFEKISTVGLRKKPAPAPTAAKLYMTTLRTIIGFAMDEYRLPDGTPIITHNPVAILKRDMRPPAARTRHIDKRQIGEFWNWLATARTAAINADAATAIDLIQFLTLTGARRSEGAALEWRNVHLDDKDPAGSWWFIEDPKNKHPIHLPLSTQAVELLKFRRTLAEKDKSESPFVFKSRSKAGHIRDTRAPLEKFGPVIGLERLSAHDLRRSFVSLGVKACKLDISKLELLTNHLPQSVTMKHYLETSDLRDYHAEVQAIADFIELEAAKARGENVVAMVRPA